MTSPLDSVLQDLLERRRLAAKKYADDPLPAGDAEARVRLQQEIQEHGLAENIVDLELNGYTILPPGKAAPIEFTNRLRDAILRVQEDRLKRNVKSAIGIDGTDIGTGRPLFHLINEDPIFEEAITNPVVLTLTSYLAGYRSVLSTATGLVKTNESDVALYWHTDNGTRLPLPWPRMSMSANVNWILTEYTRDNGALCVAPGSHVWCRQPDPGIAFDDERVEVIEVPAGSIAVWHSNLWHAAMPRKSGGSRVSFVTLYDRPFMQQGDAFPLTTTKEMIERNSARFSVLMGMFGLSLNTAEGPDFAAMPGRSRDMGRWA